MKIDKIKQQIKEIYNSQYKCDCGCNKCAIKNDSDLSDDSINEYNQSLLNNKNAPISKEYFNPLDIVTLDIPLFILLLKYAKEDAKDDMDLHKLATKAIEMSMTGGLLTMEDYNSLIPKSEIEETETKPLVKPDVKPETKPRKHRTLRPDPETTPDAPHKANYDKTMINKITQRFKKLSND
jgi:hypothetical protein